MTEKMIYGGAVLSGGSIIISGILIAFAMLAMNSGEDPGHIIFILPVMAVILVTGIVAIIYGSLEEE
jgi:VIT1/CCC1 family predicted Fe2+/Mn2+ transporter